jgi:tetratricopeptide (TPR) repeat protein
MGLFHKKSNSESLKQTPKNNSKQPEKTDHANDPNMIRVFDKYGREFYISKQEWKDKVLKGNLEKAKDDPEQLYNMLVDALKNGFSADVIKYAECLLHIDPVPSRAANLLGIIYMESNHLDDAYRVLNDYLTTHGEDGYVLTNLAKVYSRRGEQQRAETILWHSLEVEPNQENGLVWYAAIQRERGGEAAQLEAYRRIASLPRSWRARLWLARDALQHKNLAATEKLYDEAITQSGQPMPADLLFQMSGDLGNAGYVEDIIRLVQPLFDPVQHGLTVGNNLIKANIDLNRFDAAKQLIDKMYAQKRPDWQKTLGYWDTELAKVRVEKQKQTSTTQLSVGIMAIEGPLWTRGGSTFSNLLPEKSNDAKKISILGGTAIVNKSSDQFGLQLGDNPGRLSRAVPLLLAEQIHLVTDAIGIALIPWAQGQGFAVFSRFYNEQYLFDLATKSEKTTDFMAGILIDATQQIYRLTILLVRVTDKQKVAEVSVVVSPDYPGLAVEQASESLMKALASQPDIKIVSPPQWYQRPTGADLFDYLLRLEQQLVITSMHQDFLQGGGISGERDMLDGILQLCLRQPSNYVVRIVLSQTLRQIKNYKPNIISEYREKIELLKHDFPLQGEIGDFINDSINGILD